MAHPYDVRGYTSLGTRFYIVVMNRRQRRGYPACRGVHLGARPFNYEFKEPQAHLSPR